MERVLPPAWSSGSGTSKAGNFQWRHEDTNWLEQETAPLRKCWCATMHPYSVFHQVGCLKDLKVVACRRSCFETKLSNKSS